MTLLFTVYFTVICPNETFRANKPNLTLEEAESEVRYLKANSKDGGYDEVCTITDPQIGQ